MVALPGLFPYNVALVPLVVSIDMIELLEDDQLMGISTFVSYW